MNKWLYGSVLTILIKLKNILSPERIVETIKHPCTKCEILLESYILKKEDGIIEYDYYIVRCQKCKELNLLSCGPNIKHMKFGNYEYVESLSTSEYSYEQALIRLEQIKFFRK